MIVVRRLFAQKIYYDNWLFKKTKKKTIAFPIHTLYKCNQFKENMLQIA